MRSKLRGQREGRLISSSGTFPTSFIGSHRDREGHRDRIYNTTIEHERISLALMRVLTLAASIKASFRSEPCPPSVDLLKYSELIRFTCILITTLLSVVKGRVFIVFGILMPTGEEWLKWRKSIHKVLIASSYVRLKCKYIILWSLRLIKSYEESKCLLNNEYVYRSVFN